MTGAPSLRTAITALRVLVALPWRIVITQIAVIIGRMCAQRYRTMAPLVVVVGLKTLFDLLARLSAIFATGKQVEPSHP